MKLKSISVCTIGLLCALASEAQKKEAVKFAKEKDQTTIDVLVGNKLFTRFIYPDSLAKPVLYPIFAANGTMVTRGFPIMPLPGEPNDHPHHLGLWFNFENVNGLDFWNNSYAIPAEKKRLYGWIKTDQVLKTKDGPKGVLTYHANWTNMQNEVLLEETTQYEFSGTESERVIDRVTLLKAKVDVVFADAKDGLLGLRAAHELQIPDLKDRLYTDDKGVATIVKGSDDHIANGNYLTSEGKTGDSAWSTRGVWCKMFGKMKDDSISIAIIDHPENVNYPTFWHARGYGLFAANPLGEKVFTNGKSAKNLRLKEGETVRFMYRIVIDAGKTTPTAEQLNQEASDFAKEKPGDITK